MPAAHLRRDRIVDFLQDLDHQLADIEQLPVPSVDYLANEANFERTKAIKLSLACAIQDVTRISLHIATALGSGSVRSSESETILTLCHASVITTGLESRPKSPPQTKQTMI